MGPTYSPQFLLSLRNSIRSFPDANWSDSFSRGQIRSKRWLVSELVTALESGFERPNKTTSPNKPKTKLGCVYICAGWYAVLAELLCHELAHEIDFVRSFEIDSFAVKIADALMKHRVQEWQVKSCLMDIHQLNFRNDQLVLVRHSGETMIQPTTPHTVINTSCEHIFNFESWWQKIPAGILVVAQSNNFFEHHEHVNCVSTLSDFVDQTPMSENYFSGERVLEKYTRFMRIGLK